MYLSRKAWMRHPRPNKNHSPGNAEFGIVIMGFCFAPVTFGSLSKAERATMRIKEVEFPEPLLIAQKAGRLVIFAGAGVSIPPPSNLPNFPDLAERVASGALTREENEPIDRFLGRLHAQGIQVHRRVSEILRDPASAPNELHSILLQMFPRGNDARLVTTNFDIHFSTAAAALFGCIEEVEFHYAPALPLGDRFSGIVYLHGSINKPAERLVLTDADFGRAYLTEGWARRFLQGLFAEYTVLFVGYSHEDVVLQYLARGLPPDSAAGARFALTPKGKEQHWKYLGITPIPYPLTEGEKKHTVLAGALAAWADLANKGALDREQRTRQIVDLPPSLDPEESDYIEDMLKEISTARFFTRHAKKVEWLGWVEEKGFFKRLFQPGVAPELVDREIASWFADNFVSEHPGDALALVQRHGQTLSPLTWSVIAHRLFTKQSNPLPPQTLARWVSVLIGATPVGVNTELLDYLIRDCRFPEDEPTALLLFDFLTRPHVRLDKQFFRPERDEGQGEDVDAEISIYGHQYWLAEAWQRFFRPNLAALVDKLEPILTTHLQQAHLLMRAMGEASEAWDRASFFRSAIEHPEGVGIERGFGTVIDAARDVLSWYLENRPSRADSLIEAWFSSEVPLLKRLAIWGVASSDSWSAEKKIEWVLQRDLLYAFGMKHEVFLLLKNAYPNASESLRSALLERVCEGRQGGVDSLPETTRQYEIYNLLHWLHKADPACVLGKQHFEAAQRMHPDFGPREHPDMDVDISGGVWGWKSPISVEDLLSKDPDENIEWLASYQGQEILGPSREGLLETVAAAVARRYEWSQRLADALEKRELWDSDLSKHLISGWRQAELTDEQWATTLGFLRDHGRFVRSAVYEVSLLLESGVERPTHRMPASGLELALVVAEKCWSACTIDAQAEDSEERDWLFIAINNPAGKLAQFWLHAVSQKRRDAGGQWTGIPPEFKTLPDSILGGDSGAAELGRVVLASHLHFLFAIEPKWTQSNIILLFDWSVNERQALQAWHGFLGWGRWTEGLLPCLMPLYEGTFSRCSRLPEDYRRRFCEHLASIAAFSSIHPLKHGWLTRYLLAVGSEERATWAAHMREMLKGMDEGAQEAAWRNWIRDYWEKRITGVPVPLDSNEMGELVIWSVYLKPVFQDVVDKIRESPFPSLTHTFLFWSLSKSDIPHRYPKALGQLLRHLLASAREPFLHSNEVDEMVRCLVASDASRDDLLQVCDNLARLGYPRAAQLRDLVQSPPSQ